MLPTFIGLVIFSVGFVFSVSNTKYHILCSGCHEDDKLSWSSDHTNAKIGFLTTYIMVYNVGICIV
jgi:hypothetical protein